MIPFVLSEFTTKRPAFIDIDRENVTNQEISSFPGTSVHLTVWHFDVCNRCFGCINTFSYVGLY